MRVPGWKGLLMRASRWRAERPLDECLVSVLTARHGSNSRGSLWSTLGCKLHVILLVKEERELEIGAGEPFTPRFISPPRFESKWQGFLNTTL
jgi:hypothetical protein